MNIREEFLKFFKSKAHPIVPSTPFVPNDASLLFVNAGMVPFKDIFTGVVPSPEIPRATSCQTCLRAGGKHNDLENVGFTNRHHTFFEMLGNFSFGDYFKEEAIAYAWEFLTINLELPIDKLWVTIHDSDDEAYELWQKHIDKSRIKRFGDKDNFWQMGDTGACGPCSEIFYDQGEENFSSEEDYLGGEGDRFLEIWNLVFMQYERDKKGVLHPLPKPSIDTGMGLERVVAIKEKKQSNYDTSLFMPIINEISKLISKEYKYEDGASFRVISDHIRTAVFLLCEGISFDKEGRGYVLRRIVRRAIRHGYLLGFKEPFMYKLVDVVVDIMKPGYDYLVQKKENVKELIKLEEERFFKTIELGIELFNKELKQTKDLFDGKVAFKLYDTYGFPLDLTQDMLKDKGLNVDVQEFELCMNEQKTRSKANWKGSGDDSLSGDFKELLEKFGKNSFVGYEKTSHKTKVLAVLDENFILNSKAKSGWLMLEETPFYALSGGQVGDIGVLKTNNNEVQILDTQKFFELNLSKFSGDINEKVEAIVDESRSEIAKHHTATHILHSALEKLLGSHIQQAGSLVQSNRLKFDFSHPKALTQEEISKIEDMVNSIASKATPCISKEMSIDEAKKSGAKALFGDKYGDIVRVVSVSDFSVEFCGGTHINNSSEMGVFVITKESGISAGVRRIEAVVGASAYTYIKEQREDFEAIKTELKSKNPISAIVKLKDTLKEKEKEIKQLQQSSKKEFEVTTINGVSTIVDVAPTGDIKEIIDEYKNKYENLAIMLFQPNKSKVLIAAGSNSTVKAGAWVKEIASFLGGGGGGRDDFAQAGGKDVSKVEEAKVKALDFLRG